MANKASQVSSPAALIVELEKRREIDASVIIVFFHNNSSINIVSIITVAYVY